MCLDARTLDIIFCCCSGVRLRLMASWMNCTRGDIHKCTHAHVGRTVMSSNGVSTPVPSMSALLKRSSKVASKPFSVKTVGVAARRS